MPTCRRDRGDRLLVLRKSYPGTDAPCAPLRCERSAWVHPTRKCGTGGHTGRPYGPAPGFLVGAAISRPKPGLDFQKMSLGRGTLFPGSASFDSTGFRMKRWWKFGRAYPRCGLDLCRGVRYNNVSFDELCQFIWGRKYEKNGCACGGADPCRVNDSAGFCEAGRENKLEKSLF